MQEGILAYQNMDLSIIIVAAVVMHFATSVYMLINIKAASRERNKLNREIFGLTKKIEIMTSGQRELALKHYDRILAKLTHRLPGKIAEETGETIFATESRILSRLAELEPQLKTDITAKKKMEELIKNMEELERKVVSTTIEAVHKVMLESRGELLQEEKFTDTSLAA